VQVQMDDFNKLLNQAVAWKRVQGSLNPMQWEL